MAQALLAPFPPEHRAEISQWLLAHEAELPESVSLALQTHGRLLDALASNKRRLGQLLTELRRAMGIIPQSERRSGKAGPEGEPAGRRRRSRDPKQRLLEQLELLEEQRSRYCAYLRKTRGKMKRVIHQLEGLEANDPPSGDASTEPDVDEDGDEDDGLMDRFQLGNGSDGALLTSRETLMRGSAVETSEEVLPMPIPPERLEGFEVVSSRLEERIRYDFSLSVRRIVLEVEKKVVIGPDGERSVLSGSTRSVGPARFSVTWGFLVNVTILIAIYALPMHRLARMLSSPDRTFSASTLSKMFFWVARRFAPIYLQLFDNLADADIFMGDDTTVRVLEVNRFFAQGEPEEKAPWHKWPKRNSTRPCDRESPESLSEQLARELGFCFKRKNGDGNKSALHTTVLAGREVADAPESFIVFYRSHLGGLGNLLEVLLERRSASAKIVTIQSDLSTVNLVTDPRLTEKFHIRQVGCAAHARRPLARHEHEDPEMCQIMLAYFEYLAFLEGGLDTVGRNMENVQAVRSTDARSVWDSIEEGAELMTRMWSKETKLGEAARYILRHRKELTAYLDDPRLPWTNNLSERMLRLEKLIESSSMFRTSLEGRFVLDIMRTICQTAIAADVPVSQYLEHVLRTPESEVLSAPERFTPYAWAKSRPKDEHSQSDEELN